ncbi:MAG: hypothetical protein HQM10_22710 [Candidatus Riflebacteria bacterium]|nr:hypothetical protein [Candidatus Riflebacteria bacterium]
MSDFKPGFQISIFDAFFLLAVISAGVIVSDTEFWYGFSAGYIVSNFFLFCNVFRIARSSELIWTFIFMVFALFANADHVSWTTAIIVSFSSTVFLVFHETRKPSYHGIFWAKLNPNLPEWWKNKHEKYDSA